MMKQKLYFAFYVLLSISVIASQLLHLDALQNILKPLLMPSLIFIYMSLYDAKFQKYDCLIIASLFFSMLGDSFLMPYFNIFMAGLGSFLVAHILYLTAFAPEIAKPIKLTKDILLYLILGIFFFISLVFYLFSSLLETNSAVILMVAIAIYAGVLFSVFATAIFRNRKSTVSYHYILLGAALFLLSDGLLAFNKFVTPIGLSELWVMSTYTAAQAFIVFGALKRNRNE
jgi:uncharacterized membrane protein YhhN